MVRTSTDQLGQSVFKLILNYITALPICSDAVVLFCVYIYPTLVYLARLIVFNGNKEFKYKQLSCVDCRNGHSRTLADSESNPNHKC